MTQSHTIEPGDWIGAVAQRYGFEHWSTLWEHPVNASLRELRSSPDLLMVGDEIRIPDPHDDRIAGIEVSSGTRVVFRARSRDMLRLRLPGVMPFVQLFGPMPYVLEVGGEVVRGELTTQGGDTIEVPLDPRATTAKLTLMGSDTREFSIGGLGPVSEGKGAHARLQNLGIATVVAASGKDSVADPLAEALQAFQRTEGLPDDGALDHATQVALRHAYGG